MGHNPTPKLCLVTILGSGIYTHQSRWSSREEGVAMARPIPASDCFVSPALLHVTKRVNTKQSRSSLQSKRLSNHMRCLYFYIFFASVLHFLIDLLKFHLLTKNVCNDYTVMLRPCSLFLLYVAQYFICKVSPVVFLFTAVICQNPPKFTVSVGKSSIFRSCVCTIIFFCIFIGCVCFYFGGFWFVVFCYVFNLSKIQVKLLNGSLTQAIKRRLQETHFH